jgi:hypothetical protein
MSEMKLNQEDVEQQAADAACIRDVQRKIESGPGFVETTASSGGSPPRCIRGALRIEFRSSFPFSLSYDADSTTYHSQCQKHRHPRRETGYAPYENSVD